MEDLISLERAAREYQKNGDYSAAVGVYAELLTRRPDWEHGLGFYNLAGCYEDLGDYASAREAYLKALVFGGDDTIILGGYASFLYLHGSSIEALEAHLRLLRKLRSQGNQGRVDAIIGIVQELAEKTGLPKSFFSKEDALPG